MPRVFHVCIVTTAHPIDDVRVNNKFAYGFRKAGFKVTWVGPDQAFFDHSSFNRHGVNFVLAPPNRNRIDRVFCFRRITSLANTIKDVDVYYAPEPDSAQIAVKLAKKNGARAIFDIHEIFHGALLDRWLFGLRLQPLREYLRKKIARTCAMSDLVVGVSASVLKPYAPGDTTQMIVRSCAPSWFASPAIDANPKTRNEKFTFMHGKSDFRRGTREVLEATRIATQSAKDISVIMFFQGDDAKASLQNILNEMGISDYIDLRSGVPMQEMPGILGECEAGLIAYGRDLGADSLPNRIFEYMSSGLSVIAPSYSTEIAKIIDTEQCGLLVDFEEPEAIAEAMLALRNNKQSCREMGAKAKEAFLARYNWEVEMQPVIEWIVKGS
jgi:glycosyltransferase involved in cell wall biosynthesis